MADVTNEKDNLTEKIIEMENLLDIGKYSFVEREWRFLPSEVRLEIMEFCLNRGIYYFINEQHFQNWPNDVRMLQEAIREYAEQFHMTERQVEWLKEYFRGPFYDGKDSVKTLATYVRMKNYYKLTQRYSFYTPELVSQNLRMLKCDPRRTNARIQFLLEQTPEGIVTDSQFVKEIVDRNQEFNFRHQDVLEEKMEAFQEQDEYQFLLDITQNDVSEDVYAKFLEYALRTFYGDTKLLERIEQKRSQLLEKVSIVKKENLPESVEKNKKNSYMRLEVTESENGNLNGKPEDSREEAVGEQQDDSGKKQETFEQSEVEKKKWKGMIVEYGNIMMGVVVPEDVTELSNEEIKEIFEKRRKTQGATRKKETSGSLTLEDETNLDSLLVDIVNAFPIEKKPSSQRRGGTKERGISSRKPLDKQAIAAYINELSKMGITCEGRISREQGGTKAAGEDCVYYYIFCQGKYRILEPIGQPNNRTLVMRLNKEENNLEQLVKHNSIPELVKKGIMCRLNHKDNKEYDYSPIRLANILQLVNEGSKIQNWDRNRVKEEITQLLPKSEIPNAMEYISNICKETSYNIKRKIRKLEINATHQNAGTDEKVFDVGEVEI